MVTIVPIVKDNDQGNTSIVYRVGDEDVELLKIIFAFITVGFVPVILVTNTLVFWGILLYPAFNSAYHIFLFSLSIADFSMGALTIPIHFRSYVISPIADENFCVTLLVLTKIGIDGSLWHLLAISFDRYLAVIFPLKYRKIVTKTRAMTAVFIIWLYIFVLMAVPVLGNKQSLNYNITGCDYFYVFSDTYIIWSSFITKFICLAIPLVLYSHISVVVCKQVRSFNRHYLNWTQYDIKQFQKQLTILKITSALTFFFFIAWLPWLIVCFIQYYKILPEKTTRAAGIVVQTLGFANATVNAPIYAICGKKPREVYYVMITVPPWRWKDGLERLYEEDTSNNPVSSNQPSEWQVSSYGGIESSTRKESGSFPSNPSNPSQAR